MSGRRLPLILNPAAGGGRLLRHRLALDTAAHGLGVALDWRPTTAAGEGEALAREAAATGAPMVLAFGGDGTYNEVARGLLGTSCALGVLPGGTTSVLAYELAIPRPATRALAALLAGVDRPMQVGCTDRGDIFLQMLSAGPDTVVLERVRPRVKRVGGRAGVALEACHVLVGGAPLPRLRLRSNGFDGEIGWAIVGNGRMYAGRWAAAPAADPFGDGFQVVAQSSVGRRPAAGFMLGLALGRHLQRRDSLHFPATRVELGPVGGDCRYQIDGELMGPLPVTAWPAPERLMVRLPG